MIGVFECGSGARYPVFPPLYSFPYCLPKAKNDDDATGFFPSLRSSSTGLKMFKNV